MEKLTKKEYNNRLDQFICATLSGLCANNTINNYDAFGYLEADKNHIYFVKTAIQMASAIMKKRGYHANSKINHD